jgi:Family of unknown function (DUF6011)
VPVIQTNPNPATHCGCCGRALTDAVSVRIGLGPVCRTNAPAPEFRDLFTTRSDYEVELDGEFVLVTDLDRGGRSVTNDAPGVVGDLVRAGLLRPGMRILYQDSRAVWDEIVVRDGRHLGFAPINERDRTEAVSRARSSPEH